MSLIFGSFRAAQTYSEGGNLTLQLLLGLISAILLAITVFLFRKNSALLKSENELLLENQNLKNLLENQKTVQNMTNEHMSEKFSALASEALEGNTKKFLELAKVTFEKENKEAEKNLSLKEESFKNLVNPIKELLKEQKDQITQVEKQRTHTFATLENELKKVFESHSTLALQTSELKNALKKPHVRGRWGEVQLNNCIEIAGMSEYCDLSYQDSINIDDKRLIPDLTVKMPGGHIAIVDAKTPIDAFLDYIEASDEDIKKQNLERHAKHIKEHIKKLSSKEYHSAFENSADFTIMFLPNESFLYAALEAQSDIIEFAMNRKVLITTPPTFVGLLKVISHGWNEKHLSENAKSISDIGTELHKRVCDFLEAFKNLGTHLDKAQKEYDVTKTRLESRVLVQATRLEKLGAKSNKTIPEEFIAAPPETEV